MAKTADELEAHRIYRAAKAATAAEKYEASILEFKKLQNPKYKSFVAFTSEDEGPETFGEIVPKVLNDLECMKNYGARNKSKPRTADETIKELVAAIAAKDEAKLSPLISCDVTEGRPYSEYDHTSHQMALKHLLGHDGHDGYGFIESGPEKFKLIGTQPGLYVISNGVDYVSFSIHASPNTPKTARVQSILWGQHSGE